MGAGPKASRTWSSFLWTRGTGLEYFCFFKAMSFIIVHSHLEVPVGGGPGSHELSAGGGEKAVNIAPQLTGFEPATV